MNVLVDERELERLRAIENAARELEWMDNYEWSGLWCPECEREQNDGHAPDCMFGAVLAVPPIPPEGGSPE
jgi:hypothetical protein